MIRTHNPHPQSSYLHHCRQLKLLRLPRLHYLRRYFTSFHIAFVLKAIICPLAEFPLMAAISAFLTRRQHCLLNPSYRSNLHCLYRNRNRLVCHKRSLGRLFWPNFVRKTLPWLLYELSVLHHQACSNLVYGSWKLRNLVVTLDFYHLHLAHLFLTELWLDSL